jgi:putative heme iron utilization protein
MNPDDARLLATLIRKERIAHLATLRDGVPMASMTLYLPAPDFSAFYVHVSRLAWHTQDMQRDGHVALSIAETDDRRADPFRLMRVSIRGGATVFADESGEIKQAYLAKYPEQAINFTLADFSFWRIEPKDARFIAGFGRIHNVSAEELRNAAG